MKLSSIFGRHIYGLQVPRSNVLFLFLIVLLSNTALGSCLSICNFFSQCCQKREEKIYLKKQFCFELKKEAQEASTFVKKFMQLQQFRVMLLPFLTREDERSLRMSCQNLVLKIPVEQYKYYETLGNDLIRARLTTIKGFVEVRGDPRYGGDISKVEDELQSDVQNIFSTECAFAALKNNGKVITWGDKRYGGDCSKVKEELQSDVQNIVSTNLAFAALKNNGKVITWGYEEYGGDFSKVEGELQSDVQYIFSTFAAFAALKNNGKVITWGDKDFGGDSSDLVEYLAEGIIEIDVYRRNTFIATIIDGSKKTWGCTKISKSLL